MKQASKLKTIAPTPRSPAIVSTASAVTPQAEHVPAVLSAAGGAVDASESIKIDTKKAATGLGVLSISSLLSGLPGWMASLVGHTALIILLTVIATSSSDNKNAVRFDGTMIESTDLDQQLTIEQQTSESETELLSTDVAAMNSEAAKDPVDLVRDEGFSVSLLDGLADGIGTEAMSSSGLTPVNSGDSGGDESAGDGSGTQFFGAQASGERFVFVIDASGSMSSGFLWERAVMELGKSLEKLGKKKQVMVLLYNSQTIPMFNTDPANLKMLPASYKFRAALGTWLSQQVPSGKTQPAHALRYGLSLDPDAIFLLSDGQITDDSLVMLDEQNQPRQTEEGSQGKVPVHTIALGPSELGVRLLKQIAENNGGQFTRVR